VPEGSSDLSRLEKILLAGRKKVKGFATTRCFTRWNAANLCIPTSADSNPSMKISDDCAAKTTFNNVVSGDKKSPRNNKQRGNPS
jgi:hypothetical protein